MPVGPTDAVLVDAPASEPQATTSDSEKPAATRPRTKPTVKRNSTRQTKRKFTVTSEPEPVPLPTTAPATLPGHAGDNGRELDSSPAEASTLAVKRNAPRLSRQGTRSSARLKGRNSAVIHEPTLIEPVVRQTKRKRESLDEDKAVELPKKRARHSDDQTDALVQADGATASDSPPVGLVLSENVTVDHLEQPADVLAEGSAIANPSNDEPAKSRGFLPRLEDLRVVFGLGGSGS